MSTETRTRYLVKPFVTFYSPGSFFAEMTTKEIASWDVELAKKMAGEIVERHGARPYGFRFIKRSRREDELDSRIVEESPFYFLGGKIETIEEIRARNDPDEKILLGNMESNGWDRIWRSPDGWKWSQLVWPFDVLLDVE